MTVIHETQKTNPSGKADTNPWSFDDSYNFTSQNAMAAIAYTATKLLGELTTLISGMMALSANLVGPLANKWSQQGLAYLRADEAEIAFYAGPGNSQEEVTTWSNQMNVDNTGISQTTTVFNNTMNGIAQATSSNTSSYPNTAQMVNTISTGGWSSIISDWVL